MTLIQIKSRSSIQLNFTTPGCCWGSASSRMLIVNKDGAITDRKIQRFVDRFCCCFIDSKKSSENSMRAIQLFRKYLIQQYGTTVGKAAVCYSKANLNTIEEVYDYVRLNHALTFIDNAKKLEPHQAKIEQVLHEVRMYYLSLDLKLISKRDVTIEYHYEDNWNEILVAVRVADGMKPLSYQQIFDLVKSVPTTEPIKSGLFEMIVNEVCSYLLALGSDDVVSRVFLSRLVIKKCTDFRYVVSQPAIYSTLKQTHVSEIGTKDEIGGEAMVAVIRALEERNLL